MTSLPEAANRLLERLMLDTDTCPVCGDTFGHLGNCEYDAVVEALSRQGAPSFSTDEGKNGDAVKQFIHESAMESFSPEDSEDDALLLHSTEWYCSRFEIWVRAMSKTTPHFATAWSTVAGYMGKSSWLRRLLYTNEAVRTKECSVHKGRWSGLFQNKPEGCECMAKDGDEATGWIPESSTRRG